MSTTTQRKRRVSSAKAAAAERMVAALQNPVTLRAAVWKGMTGSVADAALRETDPITASAVCSAVLPAGEGEGGDAHV